MAPPGTRAKDTARARLAMAYEDFLSWAREHKVEFLSRTLQRSCSSYLPDRSCFVQALATGVQAIEHARFGDRIC